MKTVLSPQQVRERLVLSYLFSLRAQGREVDVRDVERQVVAELELVAAAARNGELHGGSPDPNPGAVRPDVLAGAQAATGTRLEVDHLEKLDQQLQRAPERGIRYRPVALHRNPMRESARWGAAVARIGRILEGAAGSTLAGAVKNAQMPLLARKWSEVYAFYMTRSMPPPANRVDHNPFRGMSDRDASRAFMRAVEDICDQSTGVLGSWYVK